MKRKMVFINLIYKNIIHLQPAWHKEPRVNDKERSNMSLLQECNIKPFTITNHTDVLHIVLALQVLWVCLLHDEELLLFPKMFFLEELPLPLYNLLQTAVDREVNGRMFIRPDILQL